MRKILIVLVGLITLDVQASTDLFIPFDDNFSPIAPTSLYQTYGVGNDEDLEAILFNPAFDENPAEYLAKRKREDDTNVTSIDTSFSQQKRVKSMIVTDIIPEIQKTIMESCTAETLTLPRPMFSANRQIIGSPSEADMERLTIEQKRQILKIESLTWKEKGGINTANVKLQWISLYKHFGAARKVTEENLCTKATILKMDQKFLENFFETEGALPLQDGGAKPIFDAIGRILYPPSEIEMEGLTIKQTSNILNEGFALSYEDKRQSYKRTPKLNDKELPWILFYLYKSKNRVDISRSVNIHPDRFSRIYCCLKAVVPDLCAVWDKPK